MGWSDVENGLRGGGGGLLRIPGDEICKIVWRNGVSWDLRIGELGCLLASDVHRDSNAWKLVVFTIEDTAALNDLA